jgi:hypothetical protein
MENVGRALSVLDSTTPTATGADAATASPSGRDGALNDMLDTPERCRDPPLRLNQDRNALPPRQHCRSVGMEGGI